MGEDDISLDPTLVSLPPTLRNNNPYRTTEKGGLGEEKKITQPQKATTRIEFPISIGCFLLPLFVKFKLFLK